jgi:hypothetical protein
MAGGKYDSSKTRVVPVFEMLAQRSDEWPRRLLELAQYGSPDAEIPADLDLSFRKGEWGECEHALAPPVSLLEWLVQHPETWASEPDTEQRRRLHAGDAQMLEQALDALRAPHGSRGWFIFEGLTYPDAYIETPDATIVVEGKRTESGPTTHTKWMANRHQIWRHIDGAWEPRGRKHVFGMFIVEGANSSVPVSWRNAARDALSTSALAGSFPHRSSEEVANLSKCFLGVCTWDQVYDTFRIDPDRIPDEVAGLGI